MSKIDEGDNVEFNEKFKNGTEALSGFVTRRVFKIKKHCQNFVMIYICFG